MRTNKPLAVHASRLPELAVRRRFAFEFEGIPFETGRLGIAKTMNLFTAGLNQLLLPRRPFGFPPTAQIEPVNFCNLSCPLCLTRVQRRRPKAFLPYDEFRALMDELGNHLVVLVLWGWGEPLLHPEIARMIRYAKGYRIQTHLSSNMNIELDKEKAETLVASGLDSLVLAVDGATQETYETYRSGGNLELVIENARTLVAAKQRLRSNTPMLTMRTVAMKHNEQDIPKLRTLAQDLGLDNYSVKTASFNRVFGGTAFNAFCLENERSWRSVLPGNWEPKRQNGFRCSRPWKRITVFATGEVVPCEFDYHTEQAFGAIRRPGAALDRWKNARARTFRKRFHKGENAFYFCRSCHYKNKQLNDCVVERIGGRRSS